MTKKAPKEERMHSIILAAVDEFVEKGYEGATMESIAARAGISKGGLYHHYTSKDEILMAANDRLSLPVYEMLHEAEQAVNIVEGLREYIFEYLDYWRQRRRELSFFLLTMTKALNFPEAWPMYEEYAEDMIGRLAALYQAGIDRGEMKPHDVRVSGMLMMSALDGMIGYMAMSRTLRLEEVVPALHDRLVKCFCSNMCSVEGQ